METFCKDAKEKETTLNLITHVEVEPAHKSDANALVPAIESAEDRGLKPEVFNRRFRCMGATIIVKRPRSMGLSLWRRLWERSRKAN